MSYPSKNIDINGFVVVKSVPGVPQADDDDQYDAKPSSIPPDMQSAMHNLAIGDQQGVMPIKFNPKIPHKSDMIVAYSTVKGWFP